MTQPALGDDWQLRLRELRGQFDQSFAEPPEPNPPEPEALLCLRVGVDPYALRVAALSGLYTDRVLAPLPEAPPELLGIAALRGELIAVYDLASLLGYPKPASARYLLLVAGASVGFACEALAGQVRAPRSEISSQGEAGALICEVACITGVAHPIIELPRLVRELERRMSGSNQTERE